MVRLYGRAPKGTRLVGAAPAGHWQTSTMIGALRTSGVAAAMLTDGPTNALVFRGFVDWILAPILQPGDIVVMDNLSAHKASGIFETIRDRGADLWYLPPYSPDLNPIEQMWSKVKSIVRSAAARTTSKLYDVIGHALRCVDISECCNYFANCGYVVT